MEKIIKKAISFTMKDKKISYFFDKKYYALSFDKNNLGRIMTNRDINQFILPLISSNTHSFCSEHYLVLGDFTSSILDDLVYFNVDEKNKN